jgi:hypothetical protein
MGCEGAQCGIHQVDVAQLFKIDARLPQEFAALPSFLPSLSLASP